MQGSHAARTCRTLAAAASGLALLAVTATGGSPADAARSPSGPGPIRPTLTRTATQSTRSTRDAGSCPGSAALRISTRHPVQRRAVAFDATSSDVDAGTVVFYDFSYGDGTDDATTQPTAVHAYAATGTYLARLNVVTSCNTVISSPAYHVVVRDGLPPTATITYPKPNQTVHFGTAGLELRGTASDPSGVASVDIAIQIVSVLRASRATTAGCYWYDGHVSLRLRVCGSPLFFPVRLAGSHWTFRMNRRAQIPPGGYAVRIRATDRVGNQTSVYSTKLGDIQGFTLIP
ncbi:MAG TPA: PKD domain-containing protein [Solirubrobacteraceae bacterium]|nr:PKD domain-containing protein [Solirubrobacteraceae bacterium]